MPESRYEVLALFTAAMVGASIFIVGTGALMPFFRSALHLTQTQLGLILSVQMLGSVAMTSVAGLLTDRFGDKAIVLWSGALMGLSLIAASLMGNYAWLIFWLLMYGIGYAAVTPAGSHAIIFFFKNADRGFAMGVRQCGVPIAGVLGSLLLPAVAAHFQYRGALAAAGVLTIIACGVASALYREPQELQGERVSLRAMLIEMLEIARDGRLILLTLTSMVLICGQFALIGFFTLTFVQEAGYALALCRRTLHARAVGRDGRPLVVGMDERPSFRRKPNLTAGRRLPARRPDRARNLASAPGNAGVDGGVARARVGFYG